ncbi:MAG: acetylornithine deacetylase [Phycisphaerales bacterium]|nr:acetylornithine deacetylase [Phycisphaerales bacterium]
MASTTNMLSDRELLRRLIAFNSVSARGDVEIANFVADYLDAAGCRVIRHEYADGARVNLIAARGPDAPGGLGLSGHLDVVPAEEPDWNSDPFTLTERGDRLVARGSADMKGFVALAINRIANAPDDLAKPLTLILTADEEIGTVGAQRVAADWRPEWPRPASVIIGEPTQLRVVRMHKGHLKTRITLRGKPAHSGYPHLGDNAIVKAGRVLHALTELVEELKAERAESSSHFPECPYPALNIGLIRGGAAVNIVPETCVIDVGMRVLPGQRSTDAIERIRAAVTKAMSNDPGALKFEVTNDSPPLLCPEDNDLHKLLCQITGQRETVGVSYASDAGPLAAIGIPCVLYGPGNIEDAHRANESIEIAQLEQAGSVVDQAIAAMCMNGDR